MWIHLDNTEKTWLEVDKVCSLLLKLKTFMIHSQQLSKLSTFKKYRNYKYDLKLFRKFLIDDLSFGRVNYWGISWEGGSRLVSQYFLTNTRTLHAIEKKIESRWRKYESEAETEGETDKETDRVRKRERQKERENKYFWKIEWEEVKEKWMSRKGPVVVKVSNKCSRWAIRSIYYYI